MIQYGSRFIKFQATGNNETVMNAFQGLFGKSTNREPSLPPAEKE